MHGHKVLCLALVCIYTAEGEASGVGLLFFHPHKCSLYVASQTKEMRQGLLIGQRKRN